MENSSQSYGASPAIWDHRVFPAARHRWTRTALTPAMQAGTRFTYAAGAEDWVDLVHLCLVAGNILWSHMAGDAP